MGSSITTKSIDRSYADRILAMDGVPLRSGSQFINANCFSTSRGTW